MLKECKVAKMGKIFYSRTFGKGGNWYISVAPNGDEIKRQGDVILCTGLLRCNPGIKYDYSLDCKYRFTMICDGEETSFEEPATFKMDSSNWYLPKGTYSTEKLHNVSDVQIKIKIWDVQC